MNVATSIVLFVLAAEGRIFVAGSLAWGVVDSSAPTTTTSSAPRSA